MAHTTRKYEGVREILPEGTLDDEGNELISLEPIEKVLYKGPKEYDNEPYWRSKMHPSGELWKNPLTGKEMHLCCGVHPIAFHGYGSKMVLQARARAVWRNRLAGEY